MVSIQWFIRNSEPSVPLRLGRQEKSSGLWKVYGVSWIVPSVGCSQGNAGTTGLYEDDHALIRFDQLLKVGQGGRTLPVSTTSINPESSNSFFEIVRSDVVFDDQG